MTLNRGYAYREQIGADGHGRTVAEYLSQHHAHASVETWRERIDRGEVELDGRRAQDERLRAGQQLVWHRPPWDEPEVPLHFGLAYEDETLVAVVKPRGLPTMPAGGFLTHTLLALVQARFPDAAPMHRLGRETSGLVLFARTPAARSLLQAAWRAHDVRKLYRTLASGVVGPDRLSLDTPIGPVAHPLLGTLHAASAEGKPSHSDAVVLERRAEATLLDVLIASGRPHQIRIHMAAAGHPLVGDPLYASGGLPKTDLPALPGDGGYLLHARELAFVHPATGATMTLSAEPPEDLRTADGR